MKVTLTSLELLGTEHYDNASQPILHLLKEKGAPIEGSFYLSVKDGFVVRRQEDPATGLLTFHFLEKKDGEG